jgi:hypothetical protein
MQRRDERRSKGDTYLLYPYCLGRRIMMSCAVQVNSRACRKKWPVGVELDPQIWGLAWFSSKWYQCQGDRTVTTRMRKAGLGLMC